MIWTRVAVSISYDGNDYIAGTSILFIVFTQLNGFNYYYSTLIILFNINNSLL